MQSLTTAFALAASIAPQRGTDWHVFWLIVFMLVLHEDARRERKRRKCELARNQPPVPARPKPPAGPR